MTSVLTNRPINLVQLSQEVGSPLLINDYGVDRLVTACDENVSELHLQTAILSHIPVAEPLSPTARLQAQVDELTDLIMDLLLGGM